MTKKQFEAIANIIRELKDEVAQPSNSFDYSITYGKLAVIDLLQERLSNWMSTQNPKFDAERFEEAARLD